MHCTIHEHLTIHSSYLIHEGEMEGVNWGKKSLQDNPMAAAERPTDQSADIKEAKWDTRVNCKNHTCRVCGPLRKLYRLVWPKENSFNPCSCLFLRWHKSVPTNPVFFSCFLAKSSPLIPNLSTHTQTYMPKGTRAKSFPAVTVGGHGLAIKVR